MYNWLLSSEGKSNIEAEITACEAQLENEQYEEGQDEFSTLTRKAMLNAKLNGYTLYHTSARCPKCGRLLYTSDVKDYPLLCPVCDENFYVSEVKYNISDLFEVSIPMDAGCYQTNQQRFHQIASNADASFIGYDDVKGLMDIGFLEDDVPAAETLHPMLMQIENIQHGREKTQVTVGAVGHGTYGETNGNVMITFEVPKDPRFDLDKAIYQAALEYCSTEIGREIYESNGCSFNIGDTIDYASDYLERNGVHLVSAVPAEDLFDLDKGLVDEYDLEIWEQKNRKEN